MLRRPVAVLLAAATAVALAGAPALAAGPGAGNGSTSLAAAPLRARATIAPEVATATGRITAFVQFTTPAGADVAAAGGTPSQVRAARAATQQAAASVLPTRASSRTARSLAVQRVVTTTNLLAGSIVTGDAAQIRALAADPLVKEIYRITPKTVQASSTDLFTKALATWQSTGQTGKGVRIGIIDTGLDYTHADFGGAGTQAAYDQAYGTDGTTPFDKNLVDPAKYGGGWDFAGPEYDASTSPVPEPDDNPIDSVEDLGGGHGTHVAGIAAGYGVQPNGTTYRGSYRTLTGVDGWPVAPGSAPGAILYALKVFGDTGSSTALITQALDWAADPDGDGDFTDRLDVVNLSLGSSGTPADDPDNLAVERLSRLGTVVVASAGNDGDVEESGGSPGNARSAIAVADSASSPLLVDGVQVTAAADPALVTTWPAQNSTDYNSASPDTTAPVAYLGARFDGCDAFSATQAKAVAGRVVWLWWDDDDGTRACGSSFRVNQAYAASAVGVLLTSSTALFGASIGGSPAIPSAQLTAAATTALEPSARAGTLTVRLGPSLAGSRTLTDTGDVLNPSSSRGIAGALGWGKPDVAAPGTLISSAAVGTGTGATTKLGTSMSAPHVAGIAALVRSAHPAWTPAQVKAAIVNTATHDVTTGLNGTGTVAGPALVGAGRVDALAAVTDTVLAYDSAHPEQTSVAFGVVDVGASTVVLRRAVTVANLGTTARTFSTSFTRSTSAGGATITAAPAAVTVPTGGTATVTLTLTADPATLARDRDPAQAAAQGGSTREYETRLSGRLLLSSGSTRLRVPVQAVPLPSSALAATGVTFADPVTTTASLQVSGRTLDTARGWASFATPLVLAATSPALAAASSTSPSVVASGDLRYVGWASTAPAVAAAGGDPTSGTLTVGVSTAGDWTSLGAVLRVQVGIDVDGDGTADYQTVVAKLAGTDVTLATTTRVSTGAVVAAYHVNEFDGRVDDGTLNGSVVDVPIPLSIVPTGSRPLLSVSTVSSYAPDSSTGVVDSVPAFQVSPYDPPLWFSSNLGARATSLITGPTTLTVHKGTGAATAAVLMLYPRNSRGYRTQVLTVTVPSPTVTTTALSVVGGTVAGNPQRLVATVTPTAATGTVTFRDGTVTVATAPVVAGQAVTTSRLGGGTHTLTATFAPSSGRWAGSTSTAVTHVVYRSGTTTTLAVTPTTVGYGQPMVATVTVAGASASPVGAVVQVLDGSRVVATGTLAGTGRSGLRRLTLPTTTAAGTHALTARLVATADLQPSVSAPVTATVARVGPTVVVTATRTGARTSLRVAVVGPRGVPAPTGSVLVALNFAQVSVAPLTNGTTTVTIPAPTADALVTVLYPGDAGYGPAIGGMFLAVG